MIRPKGQTCPGTSGGFQAHAGGIKSPFLQFHKNTGARLGVAQGLMMVQLYLKVTDTIQMDAFPFPEPLPHKVA